MTTAEQLKQLKKDLLQDEGFRQFPYKDTQGHLTIGIGRNLESNGITRDEAMMLLENDINNCWRELILLFPWIENLDPVRQNILVNMAYNLGIAGLSGFRKMLALCQEKDFVGASHEILASKAAIQCPNRYYRLAVQMEKGTL